MKKTDKKKQPSFFEEPELLRGNSCSLFAVFVSLIALFVLILVVLFFVRVSSGKFDIDLPSLKKAEKVKSVDERLGGYNPNEKVEVRLEQSDLTSLLREIPDFPLKKPEAKITPDNIIISGKTSNNFLSLILQVYLKPILAEGRLSWSIESIKAGDVIAPKQLSEMVSKNLSPDNFLPGGEEIVVERADLFGGHLLIVGIKK